MENKALEALAATVTISVAKEGESYPLTETTLDNLGQLKTTLTGNDDYFFTPSGTFFNFLEDCTLEERLKRYNGVVAVFIDGLEPSRAEMTRDMLVARRPWIASAFLSNNHRAVYAFALTDNTDPSRHAEYWEAISGSIKEAVGMAPIGGKEVDYEVPILYDKSPAENNVTVEDLFSTGEPQVKAETGGPHIPLDGLPSFFREVVEETAAQYQCPTDIAVAFGLGAVCTLVGRKYTCHDRGFDNYCQTWVAVVAPPGGSKSPVLKALFAPIFAEEKRRFGIFQAELVKWEAGEKSTPRPVWRQAYTKEVTPEARNRLLFENDGQLTMVVQEVAGMVEKWGRYSGGSSEMTDLLELRSHEAGPVNRRTSESYYLGDVCFSIVGGTQPARLNRIFGKPEMSGTGFLPRWLWVWPDNTPKRKAQRRQPDERIYKAWGDFLLYLYDIDTRMLHLSDGANDAYDAYFTDTEERMAALDEDDPLREVLSKLQIWVIELAIFHQVLADYDAKTAGDLPESEEISADAMIWAVRSCRDYFEKTAAKVLSKTVPAPKRSSGDMNKGDTIRHLARLFPDLNRTWIAKGLGVTQAYITNTLNRK